MGLCSTGKTIIMLDFRDTKPYVYVNPISPHRATSVAFIFTLILCPNMLRSFISLLWLLAAALPGALPTHATSLLTNGNFESGNTGFTTDLEFWPYTIATDPGMGDMGERKYVVNTDCNSIHSAFASFYDHTTGSGLYLTGNASTSSATNIVWSQTVTVTAYTDYQFSFWLANVYAANPASMQLQVNGSDVGSAASNSSGSAAWQQFSVSFNSGSSTSITLDLRELTLAASGDDFGLDDLSLIVAPAPLPVRLTHFSAVAEGSAAAHVAWATASEQNSSHFEVQRAIGKGSFEVVTRIEAQGNSFTTRTYAYTDQLGRLPEGSVCYYRLRQVDKDGKATLTAPQAVRVGSSPMQVAELWPNPTAADAQLRVTAGTTVRATDALGRLVWQAVAPATGEVLLVPAAAWPQGNYLLSMRTPGSTVQTLRLQR